MESDRWSARRNDASCAGSDLQGHRPHAVGGELRRRATRAPGEVFARYHALPRDGGARARLAPQGQPLQRDGRGARAAPARPRRAQAEADPRHADAATGDHQRGVRRHREAAQKGGGGATTNQATRVGAMAPNTAAATISRAPSSRASAAARTTPHTPPQKASDQRSGTPRGLVGVNENGALRANWSE